MEKPSAGPGAVAARTCKIHPVREAVARCPECSSYFCRECITEHEFRMVCASCLAKLEGERGRGRAARAAKGLRAFPLFAVVQCAFALAAAWMLFFTLGRGLLGMPDEFHDGEVFGDMVEALYRERDAAD